MHDHVAKAYRPLKEHILSVHEGVIYEEFQQKKNQNTDLKTSVQSPASQDGELLDGGCEVSRIEEFPNIPENTKELNKQEEYERDS